MTQFTRLLLIALALTAQTLHAADPDTFREWFGKCIPGALQACASISIRLSYDAADEVTHVELRISNLQPENIPVQWGVYSVTLSNMIGIRPPRYDHFTDCGDLGPPGSVEGNATKVGTVAYEEICRFTDPPVGLNVDPGTIAMKGLNGGMQVWGCMGPPSGWHNGGGAALTCPGGVAVLPINMLGHWEFTDNTVMSFGGETAENQFIRCTVGADCISVTPEPVTIVLLGSGLAGVSGVGFLKRRRNHFLRR